MTGALSSGAQDWRWAVVAIWAVIGAVAAVRAPATPSLLNIRGGSERPTEASRTEDLLTQRFSRPIGEFFAVTFEAPASYEEPAPKAALDTLLATLGRQPYIRGLVSYRSTGDTTFLSRDRAAAPPPRTWDKAASRRIRPPL